MIAPGEAALAMVGISNVIKGEVGRVGKGRLAEIDNLQKVIDEKAKALIEDTLPEPKTPPRMNYRATLDKLSRKLSPLELRQLGEKFHEDGIQHMGELLILLPQAYQRLQDLFPTDDYQTFAGPTQLVPDTERVWTFYSQLQVIDAPLGVFELMGAGALLDEQAVVVREFFPSIAQAIDDAIYKAVAAARAEKLSYKLPPRAEFGVAAWLGRRIADFDPNPQPMTPPTPPQPPTLAKLSKTLESPGQAAANPAT